MMLAIETEGLGYRAGRRFEITDLNLRVPRGSIYGFLGPNGAGKTTVIRVILGMLRARAGSITILGRSVPRDAAAMLASTGYVPERPHLYQSLSVGQSIRHHAAFFPKWNAKWAGELTDRFGLAREQSLRHLSKGEMAKVMILLALAQTPELLVLDEPTDGLDPVVRRDVLAAVLDYVSDSGATVFISSHLVHELERICDWVGVLEGGRLVSEMPMQEFKDGFKRLRISHAPAAIGVAPFVLLARDPAEGALETWVVRGWRPSMSQFFDGMGASVRDVGDLDLEEGFVELLRAARRSAR